MNRPMLFEWMLPSVMKPCFGCDARCCGPSSSRTAPRVTGTPLERAVSQQIVTRLRDLAAQHVVADAVDLHAELDLVLAAEVGVDRAVGLEVRRASAGRASTLRVRRNAREPGARCRLDRHAGQADVASSLPKMYARLLGDVRVVLIGDVVAAASAEEQLRRRHPVDVARQRPVRERRTSCCSSCPTGSVPFSAGSRPSVLAPAVVERRRASGRCR